MSAYSIDQKRTFPKVSLVCRFEVNISERTSESESPAMKVTVWMKMQKRQDEKLNQIITQVSKSDFILNYI
jgi:hypothetical protein